MINGYENYAMMPVLKLKPVMNKCNTVYFVCKGSVVVLTDNTETTQTAQTQKRKSYTNDNKTRQ